MSYVEEVLSSYFCDSISFGKYIDTDNCFGSDTIWIQRELTFHYDSHTEKGVCLAILSNFSTDTISDAIFYDWEVVLLSVDDPSSHSTIWEYWGPGRVIFPKSAEFDREITFMGSKLRVLSRTPTTIHFATKSEYSGWELQNVINSFRFLYPNILFSRLKSPDEIYAKWTGGDLYQY